jgi:hypothetical protein
MLESRPVPGLVVGESLGPIVGLAVDEGPWEPVGSGSPEEHPARSRVMVAMSPTTLW